MNATTENKHNSQNQLYRGHKIRAKKDREEKPMFGYFYCANNYHFTVNEKLYILKHDESFLASFFLSFIDFIQTIVIAMDFPLSL